MIGIRNTRQKECILRLLRQAEGPLGIQQILLHGKKELPSLGIATVYRTIKTLEEQDLVRTVPLPDGEIRWEVLSQKMVHHHHFLCRTCGRAFDLHKCPVSGGLSKFAPKGFQVDGHDLTLHGLCADCK